jgi:hypothetical protein
MPWVSRQAAAAQSRLSNAGRLAITSVVVAGAPERSPFVRVTHPTLLGKHWRVNNSARSILAEWTYSERALFVPAEPRIQTSLVGGGSASLAGPDS